ncbi:MAG: hypothetical protein H6734_21885, partial [Alphaproteobacteria bacterium]|nr:hypothetical protein [Alphaproteobacteria bacterium]
GPYDTFVHVEGPDLSVGLRQEGASIAVPPAGDVLDWAMKVLGEAEDRLRA